MRKLLARARRNLYTFTNLWTACERLLIFVDDLWTVPDRMSSCAPDIYEPADAAVPDQVEHDFENLASNHRRKSVLVPNGRSCH